MTPNHVAADFVQVTPLLLLVFGAAVTVELGVVLDSVGVLLELDRCRILISEIHG